MPFGGLKKLLKMNKMMKDVIQQTFQNTHKLKKRNENCVRMGKKAFNKFI